MRWFLPFPLFLPADPRRTADVVRYAFLPTTALELIYSGLQWPISTGSTMAITATGTIAEMSEVLVVGEKCHVGADWTSSDRLFQSRGGAAVENERLKPNSITLADSKLVADMFEPGRRQASNLSATSFEPASVMEFGFYRQRLVVKGGR